MKAVVVYESHWGNTAAIARAIGEGIGPETQVLATDEASPEVVSEADLLVAGAPLMGFRLPTDQMLMQVARQGDSERPPDLTHPSMRSWLAELPARHGFHAAFETKIRWSPGGATAAIEHELERTGSRLLSPSQRFVVKGQHGPLRQGELEKAREWGEELGQAMAGWTW
jgi:flavorubredoxin